MTSLHVLKHIRSVALIATSIACVTSVSVNAGSSPVAYSYELPNQWSLNSRRIQIDYLIGSKTVIRDQGAIVYSISYPEVVTSIISSEGNKALLMLVDTLRSGGSDYAYLMKVVEGENGVLAFEKRLPVGVEPMRKYRWVVELGAISDDGATALIKMGEPDRQVPPYTLGKIWETWNLKTQTMVSTGLKLCN